MGDGGGGPLGGEVFVHNVRACLCAFDYVNMI